MITYRFSGYYDKYSLIYCNFAENEAQKKFVYNNVIKGSINRITRHKAKEEATPDLLGAKKEIL